jgi:hypothetical protein
MKKPSAFIKTNPSFIDENVGKLRAIEGNNEVVSKYILSDNGKHYSDKKFTRKNEFRTEHGSFILKYSKFQGGGNIRKMNVIMPDVKLDKLIK